MHPIKALRHSSRQRRRHFVLAAVHPPVLPSRAAERRRGGFPEHVAVLARETLQVPEAVRQGDLLRRGPSRIARAQRGAHHRQAPNPEIPLRPHSECRCESGPQSRGRPAEGGAEVRGVDQAARVRSKVVFHQPHDPMPCRGATKCPRECAIPRPHEQLARNVQHRGAEGATGLLDFEDLRIPFRHLRCRPHERRGPRPCRRVGTEHGVCAGPADRGARRRRQQGVSRGGRQDHDGPAGVSEIGPIVDGTGTVHRNVVRPDRPSVQDERLAPAERKQDTNLARGQVAERHQWRAAPGTQHDVLEPEVGGRGTEGASTQRRRRDRGPRQGACELLEIREAGRLNAMQCHGGRSWPSARVLVRSERARKIRVRSSGGVSHRTSTGGMPAGHPPFLRAARRTATCEQRVSGFAWSMAAPARRQSRMREGFEGPWCRVAAHVFLIPIALRAVAPCPLDLKQSAPGSPRLGRRTTSRGTVASRSCCDEGARLARHQSGTPRRTECRSPEVSRTDAGVPADGPIAR